MNDKEKLINLKYKISGIGSVPHTNIDSVCDLIIEKCNIPYWPQSVNIDPREGMMVQYTENFPCIKLEDNQEQAVYNTSCNRQEEILKFYENFTTNNIDYFKISNEYARGFYGLLNRAKDISSDFLKGQVVGPVTFLSSLTGEDEKPVLFDDELSDAFVRGLAMKGVWQAKAIKNTGKIPILFFDEPVMAGFGSAYVALTAEQALEIFDKFITTVKEHEDILIGMHICGNSDWELVLQTGIDILNFDSFAYGKNFVLYPDKINEFLKRDGIIAWGAVPTSDFDENTNLEMIQNQFNEAIDELTSHGLEKQFILERSMFTPACGTGTLQKEIAEKLIDLTYKFATSM